MRGATNIRVSALYGALKELIPGMDLVDALML